MTAKEIKDRITNIFRNYMSADNMAAYDIIPSSLKSGKLYEAYIVSLVAKKLVEEESLSLYLVNNNYIALKSAPGPINRGYPRIDIYRDNLHIAELWTDIEFLSLSYSIKSTISMPQPGEYHELDIVIVPPNTSGRPAHDAIWLGVECKNTGYTKSLLKEILGIRRELSLLQNSQQTRFIRWPRALVPANPPSCLLVYTTDQNVVSYTSPGETFGIDFFYEPLNP